VSTNRSLSAISGTRSARFSRKPSEASRPRARAQSPAPLKGLLFGPDGAAMSPTHTRRSGKLYRYYISQTALNCEAAVSIAQFSSCRQLKSSASSCITSFARQRSSSKRSVRQETRPRSQGSRDAIGPHRVRGALGRTIPAEQARTVELLVKRVDVHPDRLDISLKIESLASLHDEPRAPAEFQQAD
jgi:site-specific DNA recombinase